jgi:hypothetical protein
MVEIVVHAWPSGTTSGRGCRRSSCRHMTLGWPGRFWLRSILGGAKGWASAGSATGEARGGESLLFGPRLLRRRRCPPPMRRRRCLFTLRRPELCSPRPCCYLLPLVRHGASKDLMRRCRGLLLRPHGATSLRSAALGDFLMQTEGEK